MAAAAAERRPRVGGIVPFSTVDYPGQLCAVVFLQGCPWRCGYCHNPHLLDRSGADEGWDRVRLLLARRKGLVDAVVFSGGEPTADPALCGAIEEVRAAGFGVGLHTGGAYPRRLRRVLHAVDWIGLDVKAPFGRYDAVTGVAGSGERARASAAAVLEGARDYEMRTTYHPAVIGEGDVLDLARSLAGMGARRFALQEFRADGCADAALRGVSRATRPSAALLAELDSLFPRFTYRNAP